MKENVQIVTNIRLTEATIKRVIENILKTVSKY